MGLNIEALQHSPYFLSLHHTSGSLSKDKLWKRVIAHPDWRTMADANGVRGWMHIVLSHPGTVEAMAKVLKRDQDTSWIRATDHQGRSLAFYLALGHLTDRNPAQVKGTFRSSAVPFLEAHGISLAADDGTGLWWQMLHAKLSGEWLGLAQHKRTAISLATPAEQFGAMMHAPHAVREAIAQTYVDPMNVTEQGTPAIPLPLLATEGADDAVIAWHLQAIEVLRETPDLFLEAMRQQLQEAHQSSRYGAHMRVGLGPLPWILALEDALARHDVVGDALRLYNEPSTQAYLQRDGVAPHHQALVLARTLQSTLPESATPTGRRMRM